MKKLSLTGEKFGNLTVVRPIQSKPTKWECRCTCGKLTNVLTSNLRRVSGTKSCGCINASTIKIEVNGTYPTNNFGFVTVVRYITNETIVVRFEDLNEVEVTQGNLRAGAVFNPYKPSTFNVGFTGVGVHKQKGKAQEYWSKMMQRGYCPDYKEKHPTYEGVEVCPEWHNFQNFAEWCKSRKQYGKFGFNLDKDLIKRGNKIYCPEFCSLVPQHINKLTVKKTVKRDLPQGVMASGSNFISRCYSVKDGEVYLGTFSTADLAGEAYNMFKEKTVKEYAEIFKEDLDEQVYTSLLSYTVKV